MNFLELEADLKLSFKVLIYFDFVCFFEFSRYYHWFAVRRFSTKYCKIESKVVTTVHHNNQYKEISQRPIRNRSKSQQTAQNMWARVNVSDQSATDFSLVSDWLLKACYHNGLSELEAKAS